MKKKKTTLNIASIFTYFKAFQSLHLENDHIYFLIQEVTLNIPGHAENL